MTAADLLTARAAQWAMLRPAQLDEHSLHGWIEALGLATLPELGPDLGDAALAPLDQAVASAQVIELWQWPGILRYCARERLEAVYTCIGDRHPADDFRRQADERQLSWLAAEVFSLLLAHDGPRTAAEIRGVIGAERTSVLAVERALHELARSLKVLRVGRAENGGPQWRPLLQVAPEVVKPNPRPQLGAVAELVVHYLKSRVLETEEMLVEMLAPLAGRTRVHDAIIGLNTVHQIELDNLDGRPAFRINGKQQ
ncbi:MAG: hypothetical protein ACRD01_16700 [Terriglobales bacterium]